MRGYQQRAALSILSTFILVGSFSHGMWQSWWLGLIFITSGWVVLVYRNQKSE